MTIPTLRRLGRTDLHIAPLVLGGNVFGWTADRAASFAALDAYVDGGGTMIDTADVYSAWVPGHHGGESEAMIGAWLQASGKRDKVQIATKVGMLDNEGLSATAIEAACDASLRRLGTDRIDLYFAHKDDAATPFEETLAAFAKLVQAGKVRVVGASNYAADRLEAAIDLADRDPALARYDVLQPEYNLVSRDAFEGALQDLCIAADIGVVPYYGLASGFLTGKYRSRADLGKSPRGGRMGDLVDTRMPLLATMDAIAAETRASLAQIALAWLIAQPGITAPIASATSVDQLRDLLPAMTLELLPDQHTRLTTAAA
jgi:aryl-alcohol dehydrogenase-like predicted oxidoreductase